MGRPIRHWQPGQLYFITQRTIQGRLLMLPKAEVTALIGGILAKAVHDFDIRLYGWTVLSNHLHLIVSHDTDGRRITDFMQFVGSCIARKVGHAVSWSDKFWARRFSAEPILDDEAAFERLRYIFAHGVKEGLVESAGEWPGLTCLPELIDGQEREFVWESWSKRLWARAQNGGAEPDPTSYQERHVLKWSVLPAQAALSKAERRQQVQALLREAEASARDARQGAPVLGVKAILAQDPHAKPLEVSHSRRPLCHASTRSLWDEFLGSWREIVAAYREASERFRGGELAVAFPVGTYPPWCGRASTAALAAA